jgi:hypothetical protein
MQLAAKLALNGTYGGLANKHFACFNLNVAGSVTAMGRDLIQYMETCNDQYWYNEWHLDLALHKNKSYKIIPETIYNYFIHGIDPEKYLKSSKNIFDFCAGKKILGDWKFYAEYPNKREELQKTIRYYVSNSGAKLVKENFTDGRRTLLEAGPWYQTVYLKHTAIPFNKYDINYTYYLKKINDEINKLSPKTTQLNLF